MSNPLRSLTDSPTQPWPAPAQLRSVAARRRRRHRTAVASVAAVAVAALAFTLVQARSDGGPRSPVGVNAGLHPVGRSGPALQLVSDVQPLSASDPSAKQSAAAVAQAEQEFALALLKQTNGSRTQDNVALSPSSLSIALSMLQNGATGETRAQIAQVLHTVSLSNDQQDAGWTSLTDDLTAAAKRGFTYQSANSLWLQQNLPMQQPFMDAMARYFRAGVWQVDFANNLTGATEALNSWVKKQTHGKIAQLFKDGDLDSSTILVLANAVYFTAKWKYQFDPKWTRDAAFSASDGSVTNVPFMSMDTTYTHVALPNSTTSTYQAVQLPYAGDRLAALVIMPRSGSLTSFVDGLTGPSLQHIVSQLAPTKVRLKLPKIHLEQYTNLKTTLIGLGMPRAFSDAAELSALTPVAAKVQSAVQRTYLDVDEAGTEAAAVTGISVVPLSLVPGEDLTFDHPFLFLIRDTVTGTILFSAEVQHP